MIHGKCVDDGVDKWKNVLQNSDLWLSHVSGMMLHDFLSQSMGVGMKIDFGGADGFVSKHGLNGPQVGSPFEQGSGEGMSERVWTDCFLDARLFHQFLDEMENHDA